MINESRTAPTEMPSKSSKGLPRIEGIKDPNPIENNWSLGVQLLQFLKKTMIK